MENINKKKYWIIRGVKFLLPIVVIVAGITMARYLYATRPLAKRGRPVQQPPLVETIRVTRSNHFVEIDTTGTVTASRTMTLKSRVSGFVLETSEHFLPGGLYNKGDVILKLDPQDFMLALKQQQAMLDRADAELKIEMGKQEVAREEVRIMQNTSGKVIKDAGLALRAPHLAQIKADIASIRVDMERARLNLERTVIRAPFNCMVMETNVEPGSQISSQDNLAVLSGTDAYRIEASIPMDHLKWVDFPMQEKVKGSPVEIRTKNGQFHTGWVTRLLGELSEKSLLARLLITVEDPLFLDSSSKEPSKIPLILNSYVNVTIKGKKLSQIIALPRNTARDGRFAWVLKDGHLVIKPVDIAWKNSDFLFIKDGLITGDEVVVSEISGPVEGMALRTSEISQSGTGEDK